MKIRVILYTILFFLPMTALNPSSEDGGIPFRSFFEENAETCLSRMSLDEKIGQILMFGFQGTSLDEDFAQWIGDGTVGNVKIFLRNVESKQQLIALIDSMVRLADGGVGIPPFIATDLEGGVVDHVRMPGVFRAPAAGLIGATAYAENNRAASRFIAFTLSELGINMNFAPCADVLTRTDNMVIGSRSYSSDPRLVTAMVESFVEEQKQMGILSTVKHFPGHGMTDFDSHIRLIRVDTTRREMEEVHLLPYRNLISTGVLDGCMVSHIIYDVLDPEHPAAFSPSIVKNLLRGELAFEGLVITDDLEMKGSQRYAGQIVEAFHLAFEAGDDLQLISHTKTTQIKLLENISRFFREGTLSETELDERVLRILRLKKKYLPLFYSLKSLIPDFSTLRSHALDESRKAAQEGISLLSSRISDPLPVYFRNLTRSAAKVLILSPSDEFSYLAALYMDDCTIEDIRLLPDRRENRKRIENLRPSFHGYDMIVVGLANIRQMEWATACVEEGVPFCIFAIDNPFAAFDFQKDALFIAASFDPYRPGLDSLFDSVFKTGEFDGIFPYYY
jgi:beta-glucosidase-like glycosyl hydrolase